MTDTLAEKKQAFFAPSQDTPKVETKEAETPEVETADVKAEQEQPVDDTQTKLQTLEKRFADTQKYAHTTANTLNELINRGKDNGWFEDDEAEAILSKIKTNDFSLQDNPMKAIDDKFTAEANLVGSVMGLSDEEVIERAQGFNKLLQLDPSLQQELFNIPEKQLTKWILEKGGEFNEVNPILEENGGALGAIKALSNRKPDEEAMREALKEEIRQELLAEMKGKPNLSRAGSSTREKLPEVPTSLEERKANFFKNK